MPLTPLPPTAAVTLRQRDAADADATLLPLPAMPLFLRRLMSPLSPRYFVALLRHLR